MSSEGWDGADSWGTLLANDRWGSDDELIVISDEEVFLKLPILIIYRNITFVRYA